MPRSASILTFCVTLLFVSCQNPNAGVANQAVLNASGKQIFTAKKGTPVLDGSGSDDIWETTEWQPISHLWAGKTPKPDDFTGRHKLAWDENNLYILAEITDDSLLDIHTQAFEQFWDDDCLVVFLDEDASGGAHGYSYNAFAYHIALDGRVADIAPDSSFRFFDNHCLSRRLTRDNTSTWEIAVRIYDGKQYTDDAENVPKLLSTGKKMGFALAYCDNDRSQERESFIGNVAMPNAEKNSSWLNADAFGVLELR